MPFDLSQLDDRLAADGAQRVVLGVGAAAGIGGLSAALNRSIYEGFLLVSAGSTQATALTEFLPTEWAIAFFVIAHLVPVGIAYVVAGPGPSGWGGIAAFAIGWWAVASQVRLGAHAQSYLVFGVLLYGVYRLFATRWWSDDPWIATGLRR